MSSILTVMKFRRCVISVIFINKLKKPNQIPKKQGSSSTMLVMNKGLQNIKQDINRTISSDNIDSILNNDQLFHGLIRIFNAKDYFNKSLFKIESHLKAQKLSLSVLSKQLNQQDGEYKILQITHQEDILKLTKSLESNTKKYKKKNSCCIKFSHSTASRFILVLPLIK